MQPRWWWENAIRKQKFSHYCTSVFSTISTVFAASDLSALASAFSLSFTGVMSALPVDYDIMTIEANSLLDFFIHDVIKDSKLG